MSLSQLTVPIRLQKKINSIPNLGPPVTLLLIHSANPKSRPVGIIVFVHVVRPHFSNLEKTKQQKTMFATGVTMDLAEWIIDDTCLVNF